MENYRSLWRALENISRLQEYLTIHNLDCEIRTYSYEDLSCWGNLYLYLENGEVDLLLGNNFENPPGFRIVASFDSQPYYIVTTVGNQKVLDGLNMALKKITDSNPSFSVDRYAANFQNGTDVDIPLSSAEKEYIQQRDPISVAVPRSYHPLFCLNTSSTLHPRCYLRCAGCDCRIYRTEFHLSFYRHVSGSDAVSSAGRSRSTWILHRNGGTIHRSGLNPWLLRMSIL